jgi:hypothetical protein
MTSRSVHNIGNLSTFRKIKREANEAHAGPGQAGTTDYGRMMAISKILFGQCYIWVRSEKQSFLWTQSAKIYSTICPIGPKV